MTPQKGSPSDREGGPAPVDHTRWMAAVIELLAVAGAVVVAYLHSTT